MSVPIRRQNLVDVPLVGRNQFQDGDIERAAAEIIHGDQTSLFFMQTISQRCGGWFVNQAKYFESGDFPGVFGSLALCIVEIRGNRDDSAIDRVSKKCFRPV